MEVSIVLSGERLLSDVTLYRGEFYKDRPVESYQFTTTLHLRQNGQRQWCFTLIGVTPDLVVELGTGLVQQGNDLRRQIEEQLQQ